MINKPKYSIWKNANYAIERTVDLATKEHHTLAKHAKDAGSAMVLFAVILTILIWVVTIYSIYFF